MLQSLIDPVAPKNFIQNIRGGLERLYGYASSIKCTPSVLKMMVILLHPILSVITQSKTFNNTRIRGAMWFVYLYLPILGSVQL